MDEDRESPTPPWPGRDTIGHGLQGSAEQNSGLNGPRGEVPAGVPPSAGGAFTEARLVISPGAPSPAPQQRIGAKEAEAQGNGAAPLEEEHPLDFDYAEAVPGFEAAASDCLNRALAIARSLNHVVLSSDHLMLALTMDPNARRQLERVGDVVQLREAAMQRLGKMHSRFTTGESFPSQTSDLKDIRNAAREAAAEREQLVAINDLINAFAKANGRLTYGSGDGSQALALMGKIEQGLVPRVADAMTRIETLVRDALERQQTVQSMLQDLSVKNWEETERRQREFMDEMRRQVREAADSQFAAVLSELAARLSPEPAEEAVIEEPPVGEQVVDITPPAASLPEPAARPRSYWSWLAL